MITSDHTGFEFVLPTLFHGYTLRMRGFELDHFTGRLCVNSVEEFCHLALRARITDIHLKFG